MSVQFAATPCACIKRGIQLGIVTAALCISACPGATAQARTMAPGSPCKTAGTANLTTQCLIAYARKADRQLERMLRVLTKQLKRETHRRSGAIS